MVTKKLTNKQASLELLDLNHKAKKAVGDFFNLMVIEEDIATVPLAPLLSAQDIGITAANLLSSVKPTAPELPKIQGLTAAVSKVIEIYNQEGDNLLLPANIAFMPSKKPDELDMVAVLDNLANQIHDAAMDIVDITGEIGGCLVEKILPDEAHAVSKYCSGVLSPISKAVVVKESPKKIFFCSYCKNIFTNPDDLAKHMQEKHPGKNGEGKTKFIKHAQVIRHKLGIHKVDVSPSSEDGKATIALEYHDSVGYPDSKTRLEGVRQRLVKEGFECYPQPGNIIYCWNDIEKDKLTRLATFFSLLFNADVSHMGKDTVPVVSDKAWDIAGKLIQEHGDEVYKIHQDQVDWSTAHHQWQQEKVIYENKAIYESLRNLFILRDKHHKLIQEAYHVEALHATGMNIEDPEGIKKVIKNDHEAIDILKKNKWPYSNLENAVDNLEKALAQGQKQLMGAVDKVGNTLHTTVAALLVEQGMYGGCQTTKGDIYNINAGDLAYCEGVLKGTSCSFRKSGNMHIHQVVPNSYKTFILDEDPEGGYHVTVFLPSEITGDIMTDELRNFLKAHHNFKCAAGKCTTYTKSLAEIRQLALLISNLKGASDDIGGECIHKAIELADAAASKQNQDKHIFAFTQEPVMPNSKAWIDLCHKKYNILPPGLTEKEKQTLQLIGPEKVYGGCDFNKSEVIPDWGILTYCEGVMGNPQDKINAHLNAQGQLDHFFHDEMDRIASVNITSIGSEGKFLVELNDINMRGEALQKETITELKKSGFTCPNQNQCSAELTMPNIRMMAAFLSNLHQIYKLAPTCTKQAVSYTEAKLGALPNNEELYKHVAYPWYMEEWNKEVCSKIAGGEAPVPVLPKVKEAGPAVAEWKSWGPVPKPPFKVHGCTSKIKTTPTKIKAAYCSGVIGTAISGGEEKQFHLQGLLPGTAASLGSKENIHYLHAGTPVLFDSKWNSLIITLPDNLMKIKPVVDTLTISFSMKHKEGNTFTRSYIWSNETARLARFFSYLSGMASLPEWCHEKAVAYALKKATDEKDAPIYPFLDSDWLKEVCGAEAKAPTPDQIIAEPWKYTSKEHGLYPDVIAINKCFEDELAALTGIKGLQTPFCSDLVGNLEWQAAYGVGIGGFQEIWAECLKKLKVKVKEEAPKKPGLTPDQLKSQILNIMEVEPGNKTEFNSLKNDIQEYYTVSTEGIAEAVDELFKEDKLQNYGGTVWGLPEGAAKPSIDTLIEKQGKVLNDLAGNLTDEQWAKAGKTTEYKKLPKAIKDWIHALMNLRLLEAHKIASPTYAQKEVEKSTIHGGMIIPITPKMVELQLAIEKKSKIRKGELPAEPGEKVAKKYEDLTIDEQSEIASDMIEAAKGGANENEIVLAMKTKYGLEYSPKLSETALNAIKGYSQAAPNYLKEPWLYSGTGAGLEIEQSAADGISKCFIEKVKQAGSKYSFGGNYYPVSLAGAVSSLVLSEETIKKLWLECYEEWEEAQPQVKKGKAPTVALLPQLDQDAINLSITANYILGHTAPEITQIILKEYPSLIHYSLLDYVAKEMGKAAVEEKKLKSYVDLTPTDKAAMREKIIEWLLLGMREDNIYKNLAAEYNLAEDSQTENWIDNAIAKAKGEGEEEEKPSIEEVTYIEALLKAHPGDPYHAKDIVQHIHEKEGITIPEEKVQKVLEGLTQAGEIKWVLHNNTYFWGEPTKKPGATLITPGLKKWDDLTDEDKEGIVNYIKKNKALDMSEDEIMDAISTVGGVDPKSIPVNIYLGEDTEVIDMNEYPTEKTSALNSRILELAKEYESANDISNIVSTAFNIELNEHLTDHVKEVLAAHEGEGEEEEELKFYGALSEDQQAGVRKDIATAVKKGTTKNELIQYLLEAYGIYTDTPLEEVIDEFYEKKEEYWSVTIEDAPAITGFKAIIQNQWQQGKSEWEIKTYLNAQYHLLKDDALKELVNEALSEIGVKITQLPEKALDETISSFIQMGWSPEGVMEFLGDQGDPKLILKKAKKIYNIYKPELRPVIHPYDELNPSLKGHLEKLAAKLLSEGKSQEDTAWYIAHNYSVDKTSVKPMVGEIAEKPLSQVELAVQAMKVLGAGEYIGGCELATQPLKLVPQTVAYCQGILNKEGTIDDGDLITHKSDSQVIDIATQILDSKWNTDIIYHTTLADNWETRLHGLPDILTDLLGDDSECIQPAGLDSVLKCGIKGSDGMSVSVADQDRLRRAAIFLSSIDNVAKLEESCIPKALQYAKEKSININQTSKPWTVNIFPDKVEDWDKIVCSK